MQIPKILNGSQLQKVELLLHTTTIPTTTTTAPTIINPPVITQADQTSTELSFADTPAYVFILVLVNVIGIAVLITLITRTLIKRNQ